MNTFLPCNDFKVCARVLDPARLNRQISEITQFSRTLWVYEKILLVNDRKIPWGVNFPLAIQLWTTGEGEVLLRELYDYQRAMNEEYYKFTKKDHLSYKGIYWPKFLEHQPKTSRKVVWPASVHESHRSKLMGKDAGYYKNSFMREGLSVPQTGLSYDWSHPELQGSVFQERETVK